MQQGQKALEDKKATDERDLSVARMVLKQEREEFESQKASAANEVKACTRKHASDGLNEGAIEKMQLDNVKLEQRLTKFEYKLALMNTPAAKGMRQPHTNGPVKGSAANGVGATGCGHKHYKPPRKFNRKVVGMVYE
ncbi:hypothetical protein MBLNU13_g07967t1 [Cladosporium sp. NU13]